MSVLVGGGGGGGGVRALLLRAHMPEDNAIVFVHLFFHTVDRMGSS